MLKQVHSELSHVVNKLSSGLGVLDSANFHLVEANQQLSDWLKYQSSPTPIQLLIPAVRIQRLQKVISKNRKYRIKVALKDNSFGLFVDFSFSKIETSNGRSLILVEGVADDNKHEIDALVASYQETMENYKNELVEQRELAVKADRDKTMVLVTMNEKLEAKVRERTRELERAKLKLSHQANHDVLTGLANRRLFNDRLQHAIAMARRREKQLALFYLDLDKFKHINDTLGHSIGDELLIQVGARLHQCTRESDTIARMGGDEFSILAEVISQRYAAIVAKKIIDKISLPFSIRGHKLTISVSIGICISDGVDATVSSIFQAADVAMYKVKFAGRKDYCFYTQDMMLDITERRSLKVALGNAIQQDELFLHYQPKVDLQTNQVSGCEALLRWQNPTFGLVSPDVFIPIAEEIGLINELGIWVLENAIDQINDWKRRNIPIPRMAINLSGKQLDSLAVVNDFNSIIAAKLTEPDMLEFELTESVLMRNDSSESIESLEIFRTNGHLISIDDFGTGYSSLSYLQYLPVDILKIDQSFISRLSDGEQEQALVLAILGIAKSMKLKVVAEGIESEEHREFLIKNGCDEGQGFLFSKPVPAPELEIFTLARREELK